jgi:hypothetical protein
VNFSMTYRRTGSSHYDLASKLTTGPVMDYVQKAAALFTVQDQLELCYIIAKINCRLGDFESNLAQVRMSILLNEVKIYAGDPLVHVGLSLVVHEDHFSHIEMYLGQQTCNIDLSAQADVFGCVNYATRLYCGFLLNVHAAERKKLIDSVVSHIFEGKHHERPEILVQSLLRTLV